MKKLNVQTTIIALTALALFSCQKKAEDTATTSPKTLYVATGACFSGFGAAIKTTYTAAAGSATRSIERFNSSTGGNNGQLIDFTNSSFLAGMSPQKLLDNGDSLYLQMENATTTTERAIWSVPKSNPMGYTKLYANATPFSGILKGMARDTDGAFIVGVTTKIEKITSSLVRLPAGANPWVNAPAAPCATSTTGINDVELISPLSPSTSGKILYSHRSTAAGAATQRLGSISASGYFVAGDCTGGVQISSVTHTRAASAVSTGAIAFNTNGTSPTGMVFISTSGGAATGKLIVAYSNDQLTNNNAGAYNVNHAIVMWDVTEGTNSVTFNNPVILYDDVSVIYGISALAYDPDTASLYVATGGEPSVANMATNNVGYNIEKFTLDINTPLLTRVTAAGNQPFIKGGSNTKCISSMVLGN